MSLLRWFPHALLVSLAGATLLGCTCSREEQPPLPVAQQPEAQTPAIPTKVDEALLVELQAAAQDCKKTEERIDCNGGKKNALVLSFNRGDKKRVESLPTFAYAFSLNDPALSALSAAVLYGAFRLGLSSGSEEPKPESLSQEDAKALLDSALALSGQPSMQSVPAAVHAVLLTGQADYLKQVITSQLPIQVRTMALRYMMTYGRLAVFPEVRDASLEPATAVVLASVESPRNMRNWTDEERAEVCPWLMGFLKDERAPVSGNAMAGLTHCSESDLDAVLTRIDKSLKDKQFSFIHSTALRELCGKAQAANGGLATDRQCKRVRTLQEQAVASKDVMARVRAMNLANLAYDWPDAQSLKLAKKFTDDPAPELQRAAEQAVRRLEPELASKKEE